MESLQLSIELRLHGVLGLMGLKHQRGRVTQLTYEGLCGGFLSTSVFEGGDEVTASSCGIYVCVCTLLNGLLTARRAGCKE